jgi:hypothetical protein
MPTYNVHLYREMRLYYPDIQASSPEEAAAIVRDKPSHDAEQIHDCERNLVRPGRRARRPGLSPIA